MNVNFTKSKDGLLLSYFCENEWDSITKVTKEHFYRIDAILLDFSKAFDKVHHTSLLKKLKLFGISGTLHQWIQDFLIGREQTVIVNGTK